jgi:hypothetical protein
MQLNVGIENNVEGRSMAWALDFPGCYSYGVDDDKALAALPLAFTNYSAWIASRNKGSSWLETDDIALNVVSTWEVYSIDEQFDLAEQGYEVNAWFLHDWKPLTSQDVERGLSLLEWGRVDLMDAVAGLDQTKLKQKYPGERWSIEGILRHVGGAEWWYLDRLGLAFPQERLPENAFERLELVRAQTQATLPALVGLKQVTGVEGEFWSPRKVLRRTVWHERDHTEHIHKLVGS